MFLLLFIRFIFVFLFHSRSAIARAAMTAATGLTNFPFPFSGAANQPGVEGTIVPFDGGYKITIPVHMIFDSPFSQTIDGQIVAYTSGVPRASQHNPVGNDRLGFCLPSTAPQVPFLVGEGRGQLRGLKDS